VVIIDSKVAALLEEVRGIDWSVWSISLPNRLFVYEPDRVLPAFHSLAEARTEREASDAYSALLSAIGHNHSGTPYTVMSAATPLLARLVPLLTVSAAAGMDAVTDCALWSAGEPPFTGPDGQVHDLGQDTRRALQSLEPLARRWLEQASGARQTEAAAGLLEALAELG